MDTFLARYGSDVKGVLVGFDRVRFRGTLRMLANLSGMENFLAYRGILYKDFDAYMECRRQWILAGARELANHAGCPYEYLGFRSVRKEDYVRELVGLGIKPGLQCVLSCVEPGMVYEIYRNKERKRLELNYREGRCQHLYFYQYHEELGWLHVRLQTRPPFNVYVVINGREWLGRQLLKRGLTYERRDNCFVEVSDWKVAQELLSSQLKTNWVSLLEGLVMGVHPHYQQMFGSDLFQYYWSAYEVEWARDYAFRSEQSLQRVYERVTTQALKHLGCRDVLRFLGKSPRLDMVSDSEVTCDWGRRVEGLRLKFTHAENSIKMYDKQGVVLRMETTSNNPRRFNVYRQSEGDPLGQPRWLPMRKGVADLERRAEYSENCNQRLCEALAAVETSDSVEECAGQVSERKTWKGRSVRGMNPLSKADAKLLKQVSCGDYLVHGFRNKELSEGLFGRGKNPKERLKNSRKTTRLIRLLRAHSIVQKIGKSHRYHVSQEGRKIITSLLTAISSSCKKLTEMSI